MKYNIGQKVGYATVSAIVEFDTYIYLLKEITKASEEYIKSRLSEAKDFQGDNEYIYFLKFDEPVQNISFPEFLEFCKTSYGKKLYDIVGSESKEQLYQIYDEVYARSNYIGCPVGCVEKRGRKIGYEFKEDSDSRLTV